MCETRDDLPLLADAPDTPARRPGGTAAGLTLAQAEGLLDWLEAHGCTGLVATSLEGGATVNWDCRE
jgi:hypothetical protein